MGFDPFPKVKLRMGWVFSQLCSGTLPAFWGRYVAATSPGCQSEPARTDGPREDESPQRHKSFAWDGVCLCLCGSLSRHSLGFWGSGSVCLSCSWDDSSSVSSGISDTIDNLSTDDINTSSSISSYANTPASSRKNLDVQVRNSVRPGSPKGPASREPRACGPRGCWACAESPGPRGEAQPPARCLCPCPPAAASPAGSRVLDVGVGRSHMSVWWPW